MISFHASVILSLEARSMISWRILLLADCTNLRGRGSAYGTLLEDFLASECAIVLSVKVC